MMIIRTEYPQDYQQVYDLLIDAFQDVEHSDQKEHLLVERLRKTDGFVAELSIVAEVGHEIVGYILLTKVQIINGDQSHELLALAPVAVLKKFQNKGIGGMLIKNAHAKASALHFDSIVLLGDANYYSKFGYKTSTLYGVKLPFDVPDEYGMILELKENSLENVSGIVQYPSAFFED